MSEQWHSRTFLGSVEQDSIFFDVLVHGDDVRPGQELQDGSGGDDRSDSKLHEGAAIRG